MFCWLMQRSDAVGLVVIDEEDNQTLLVHRISADDIYRRQEGAICVSYFVGGSVVDSVGSAPVATGSVVVGIVYYDSSRTFPSFP